MANTAGWRACFQVFAGDDRDPVYLKARGVPLCVNNHNKLISYDLVSLLKFSVIGRGNLFFYTFSLIILDA